MDRCSLHYIHTRGGGGLQSTSKLVCVCVKRGSKDQVEEKIEGWRRILTFEVVFLVNVLLEEIFKFCCCDCCCCCCCVLLGWLFCDWWLAAAADWWGGKWRRMFLDPSMTGCWKVDDYYQIICIIWIWLFNLKKKCPQWHFEWLDFGTDFGLHCGG